MSGAAESGLSPEQMREAIEGLSSPDKIDSPFGLLEFFDGLPLPSTVSTVYDALDLMRGIEVFLNAVPGASLVADAPRNAISRHHLPTGHPVHRPASELP